MGIRPRLLTMSHQMDLPLHLPDGLYQTQHHGLVRTLLAEGVDNGKHHRAVPNSPVQGLISALNRLGVDILKDVDDVSIHNPNSRGKSASLQDFVM